jgi:hypothetical protein
MGRIGDGANGRTRRGEYALLRSNVRAPAMRSQLALRGIFPHQKKIVIRFGVDRKKSALLRSTRVERLPDQR